MDRKRLEAIVRQFLEAIGEDPDREGLRDTPARVARMYETELLMGQGKDLREALNTVFTESYGGLVLVRDIPFYSLCEHHLLPFFGKAHVGYVPRGKVVGLSKVARLVEAAARRLTIQERMTEEIADTLYETLNPEGVMVVLEAEHFCMTMRGVQRPGTITTTAAARGHFVHDTRARDEFFSLIRNKRPY